MNDHAIKSELKTWLPFGLSWAQAIPPEITIAIIVIDQRIMSFATSLWMCESPGASRSRTAWREKSLPERFFTPRREKSLYHACCSRP
jgi:hypothetical protein